MKDCFDRLIDLPEFPVEGEAKGDNLLGVHQTKTVKNWKGVYNFNSCVVLSIKWIWEYFYTGREAKGLDNRYASNLCNSG